MISNPRHATTYCPCKDGPSKAAYLLRFQQQDQPHCAQAGDFDDVLSSRVPADQGRGLPIDQAINEGERDRGDGAER